MVASIWSALAYLLVQKAFLANPTVKAAQAALRQAQEMVYAQQGYFYPTINADYNFERQKLAGNLSDSSAPGAQGNGSDISAYQNPSPEPPPHNSPLYYNFHTAGSTVGFVMSSAAIDEESNPWTHRPRCSASSLKRRTSVSHRTSLPQPFKRLRRGRRSPQSKKSLRITRNRCNCCATNSNTAMRCGSTWLFKSCS